MGGLGTDGERVSKLVTATCGLPRDCLDCAVAARCRNRCACANMAMTGSLEVPGETLCFHEQLTIGVADQAAAQLFEQHNEAFIRQHYGSLP
jgi:hypothetical protein